MPIPNLRFVSHSSNFSGNNEKKPRKRKLPWKKIFKKLFVWGLYAFCVLVVYLIGAFAWYSRDLPDPNKILERNVAQSTKIYDREGKTVLYDVHGNEQRTLVKLSDIPDYVKWATISAEDKTFYEHKGFNLLAMFKGTIIDPLLGRRARGGSTLTQQFVKNSILTNERSIARKIKEFILSYKIEKIFSKDEILQMYLNEIPYGSVAYGVQSASQTFFGKEVKDLTLGESAILAGIPQAPTYYSPYGSHIKELFNRQKYVLTQMVDNGYITQQQADEAQKQEIKFALKRQSITAPHFVMYVKDILSKEFGEEFVETGGLKVTTTLDLTKQKIAEEAITAGVESKGKNYNFNNAALISLDPKNGQILAMVGSKDYFDLENQGNFNVITGLRQPGSSIKPLVYLTAFEKGYTPDTVLYDVDTIFKNDDGTDYHPYNYDAKDHGPVTIRQSLAGSLNIPAVKTLYLVGVQNMVDQLQKFGYTSFGDRSRFGLSLVLGGGEVRPLEHAAAYATIANDGVYNPPVGILKVEDSKGNVLLEYKEKSKKIIDEKYLDMLTSIMSDDSARAYIFGTNGPLTLPDRPVAAKTGTTNDYKDAWTAGFTPSLVSVVWVGNNSGAEMKKGADGSVVAAPIWNEYMKKSLADSPVENFRGYVLETTGKPVLDGNISGGKIVKIDKFSNKLATEFTPANAVVEKNFYEAHCILHYVYKDDPRGEAPSDPVSADSQYIPWEEAVRSWTQKQVGADVGMSNEKPPTEFDDLHIPTNKPSIHFTSPSNNADISNMQIFAAINVSAPRGLAKVEYYLDNVLLEVKFYPPYDLNYFFRSYFTRGYHKLRAIAFDDVENSSEDSIDVNVQVDLPMPGFNWLSPANNSVFERNQLPINISGNVSDLSSTKKVNFYARNKDTGATTLAGTVIAPDNNVVSLRWGDLAPAGNYEIFAELVDQNNYKFESARIEVSLEK